MTNLFNVDQVVHQLVSSGSCVGKLRRKKLFCGFQGIGSLQGIVKELLAFACLQQCRKKKFIDRKFTLRSSRKTTNLENYWGLQQLFLSKAFYGIEKIQPSISAKTLFKFLPLKCLRFFKRFSITNYIKIYQVKNKQITKNS